MIFLKRLTVVRVFVVVHFSGRLESRIVNQVGFKPEHGTDLCIFLQKASASYYVNKLRYFTEVITQSVAYKINKVFCTYVYSETTGESV